MASMINQYLWLGIFRTLCLYKAQFQSFIYFSIHRDWPDCHKYIPRTLNSYNLLVLSWSVTEAEYTGPFKLKIRYEPFLKRLKINRTKKKRKTREIHWPTFVFLEVTQLYLTLCNPMDYTVHTILQARILEWVAIPFSRGSSQPRNRTQFSYIVGRFFTNWATRDCSFKPVLKSIHSRQREGLNPGCAHRAASSRWPQGWAFWGWASFTLPGDIFALFYIH